LPGISVKLTSDEVHKIRKLPEINEDTINPEQEKVKKTVRIPKIQKSERRLWKKPLKQMEIPSKSRKGSRKKKEKDPIWYPPRKSRRIAQRNNGGKPHEINLISDDENEGAERAQSPPPMRRSRRRMGKAPLSNGALVAVYPKEGTDRIQIIQDDLDRLAPEKQLNDSIIDFYLKWFFQEKCTPEQREEYHVFSTFFFVKIKGISRSNAAEKFEKVRKWTSSIDIFQKKFIIIPINEHEHWTMIIVCNLHNIKAAKNIRVTAGANWEHQVRDMERPPIILYFDSLKTGNSMPKYCRIVRNYLQEAYKKVKDAEIKIDAKLVPSIKVQTPQQTNNTDCGVFLLHYAEKFSEVPFWKRFDADRRKDWFNLSEIRKKRKNIREIILNLKKEAAAKFLTDEGSGYNEEKDIDKKVNNSAKISDLEEALKLSMETAQQEEAKRKKTKVEENAVQQDNSKDHGQIQNPADQLPADSIIEESANADSSSDDKSSEEELLKVAAEKEEHSENKDSKEQLLILDHEQQPESKDSKEQLSMVEQQLKNKDSKEELPMVTLDNEPQSDSRNENSPQSGNIRKESSHCQADSYLREAKTQKANSKFVKIEDSIQKKNITIIDTTLNDKCQEQAQSSSKTPKETSCSEIDAVSSLLADEEKIKKPVFSNRSMIDEDEPIEEEEYLSENGQEVIKIKKELEKEGIERCGGPWSAVGKVLVNGKKDTMRKSLKKLVGKSSS